MKRKVRKLAQRMMDGEQLFNCGTLRIDVRLYVPGWYKVTIVGNEILHQTKVEERDHFHAASEAVHQLWADNAHSIKGEMVPTYGSIPYVAPMEIYIR